MKRKLSILVLLMIFSFLGASALPAQAQETQDVMSVSPCLKYQIPSAALVGRTTTVAFTAAAYPCNTCETEAWKRCDEAIAGGGNSCDCTKAYVDYCWANCRICKHCSIHIFFYQDTGCP